ncbi:MAG: aldolase/citrate lyase family protein [Pseudomonadota bacterium]
MQPNPIRAAMASGNTVIAMWMALGSPEIAEAAVRHGWRTLLVDNEHGASNLDRAVEIHRAALSGGGDVILRVPSANPDYLKHVTDRGFRTIMAPMINTAEDAETFTKACRYPPLGTRGYSAPTVRASGYGADPNYRARSHEDLLLIAQIEHTEAVKNLDAIAAVDGIDVLFTGPNDLAGSIGQLENLGHPDVLALCEKVEETVLKSGKWLGSIPRPGRTAQELHALGCRLIAGPLDINIFTAGARAALDDYDLT